MKKICSIFLVMFILISFSCVYAGDFSITVSPQNVSIDGVKKDFEVYNINGNNFFKLRDVAYSLNGTGSQFSVDFNQEKSSIEINKGSAYVSVGGEMSKETDKSKMAVKSAQKLIINNLEKELTAYNIGGNNFFKMRDLGNELDFDVDFDSSSNTVVVKSKAKDEIVEITSVVAKTFDEIMFVEVETNAPVTSYSSNVLAEPDRVYLDIPNSKLMLANNTINVNYKDLTSVRVGNQGNNLNRVVLDVESYSSHKIVQSADKKTTYIALSNSFDLADVLKNPNKGLLVYNGDVIHISSGDIPDISETDPDIEVTPSDEELNNRIRITSVKYSSSNDKIKIIGEENLKCSPSKMENPFRIILDFENAVLDIEGPTSITPNNKNISEIRFSQYEAKIVRVVIELKQDMEYYISDGSTTVEVAFKEPSNSNIKYESTNDCGILTLYDVKKSVFTVTESTKKCTLKFSSSKFKTDNDEIEIDDGWVDDISIKNGKIVITTSQKSIFKVTQSGSDVLVKIMNEEQNEDGNFVILLDAGHGGSDPGACHNGGRTPEEQEKTYTLAIMLKLKKLLEQTDGITVRASRTKDVYLDRQGRIDYILNNEDADMLVSVHINSLANKNYQGTMVLFYNKPNEKEDYGITSKELATYIKNNLVSDLDLVDRGVISREDLWILEQNAAGKISQSAGEERPVTNLPAVLCELCFISNEDDFAKLQTEEFQDGAAEAIYKGILSAKEQMGK